MSDIINFEKEILRRQMEGYSDEAIAYFIKRCLTTSGALLRQIKYLSEMYPGMMDEVMDEMEREAREMDDGDI